jgi:amino acid transporter
MLCRFVYECHTMTQETTPVLQRHFGLLQATALNITQIVGAGVFATIPFMVRELPGPYALLGWIVGASLMFLDSTVWSELGAMMPGSGGSALYLLEGFGRDKWGKPMAFLFIWQFLISGPLELASGLIAIATFANSLHPAFRAFNEANTWTAGTALTHDFVLGFTVNPARVLALLLGVLIVFLLYRRIATLGKLTVFIWLGVLGAIAWILLEGGARFDMGRVFAMPESRPDDIGKHLGAAIALAMYSYLGYYNVCYVGDEVRDPGKTIPRAVFLSATIVTGLFIALHVAMLSVVPWQELPRDEKALGNFSLAAEFMRRIYGDGSKAMTIITLLLIFSCFGSAFAGMLGYARVPFGAARNGYFFSAFGAVHARHRIPHLGLFLVGALTLFWSFFDLENVIKALIVTRILEQFVAQIVGVMRLRYVQPDRPRPFRIWLYPLPCLLALAGWVFVYFTAGIVLIGLGLAALVLGIIAYVVWATRTRTWPFAGIR